MLSVSFITGLNLKTFMISFSIYLYIKPSLHNAISYCWQVSYLSDIDAEYHQKCLSLLIVGLFGYSEYCC